MKRYNSKIGIGILLFVLVILGGSTVFMIYKKIWIGLIVIGIFALLIGHIFSTTYYLVKDGVLKIKSSFVVNESIDIESIMKISETRNPLSSPANSLDRLKITYKGNSSIMISPKDKIGFVNHLKKINSNIEIDMEN